MDVTASAIALTNPSGLSDLRGDEFVEVVLDGWSGLVKEDTFTFTANVPLDPASVQATDFAGLAVC